MAADDLTLTANGRALAGWENIAVTLRAEGFPNSFEIALSSRDPVTSSDVIVRPGDACVVKLGSDVVVTGYVDRLGHGGSSGAHALSVVGRGKCQDLVDCSAEWPSGQISGANALEIATKLAKPYGIAVRQAGDADPGPEIPQFALTYGETAGDIIQRVARAAGLLAYEDATGALVLGRAGSKKAKSGLVYGGNVETWNVELSMDGRYSDIVCMRIAQDILGDLGEGGWDFDHEPDPNVRRHRLMYMTLHDAATGAQEFTKLLAKWEVARRAGRATSVTATVDSWRDSDSALWAPNTLVPVSLPGLPASLSPLAISEVTFRRDESGTHADLALLPPAAFAPEPISLQPINTSEFR